MSLYEAAANERKLPGLVTLDHRRVHINISLEGGSENQFYRCHQVHPQTKDQSQFPLAKHLLTPVRVGSWPDWILGNTVVVQMHLSPYN